MYSEMHGQSRKIHPGHATGRAQCGSFTDCLVSSANYLKSFSDDLRLYSDCAKLPFHMRGYFAWKKGLPFSYVTAVAPRLDEGGVEAADKTFQKSTNGNYPVRRKDIVMSDSNQMEFANRALFFMGETVSTGTLRLNPNSDGAAPREKIDDFYSPRIAIGSIRPGTIMYNPAGHVAVVYDVYKNGTIRILSAHPSDAQHPYGSLNREDFSSSKLELSRLTQYGHLHNDFWHLNELPPVSMDESF